MAADIYAQHTAAFSRVSAFVILKGSDRVATVAIKFPADGASRLYAYVHWIGVEMVRGHANGYGYDKRSAAVWSAAGRMTLDNLTNCPNGNRDAAEAFRAALTSNDGWDWTRKLEAAGFTVLQAV